LRGADESVVGAGERASCWDGWVAEGGEGDGRENEGAPDLGGGLSDLGGIIMCGIPGVVVGKKRERKIARANAAQRRRVFLFWRWWGRAWGGKGGAMSKSSIGRWVRVFEKRGGGRVRR
jgi:hypothetical protein